MKAYELLYIVDPSSNEEVRAGVSARIDVAIAGQGGTVDSVEDWGKRKLAYEIDGLSEGDYILINFHADSTQIQELDRVLRINDAVKRHMIVARAEKEQDQVNKDIDQKIQCHIKGRELIKGAPELHVAVKLHGKKADRRCRNGRYDGKPFIQLR